MLPVGVPLVLWLADTLDPGCYDGDTPENVDALRRESELIFAGAGLLALGVQILLIRRLLHGLPRRRRRVLWAPSLLVLALLWFPGAFLGSWSDCS